MKDLRLKTRKWSEEEMETGQANMLSLPTEIGSLIHWFIGQLTITWFRFMFSVEIFGQNFALSIKFTRNVERFETENEKMTRGRNGNGTGKHAEFNQWDWMVDSLIHWTADSSFRFVFSVEIFGQNFALSIKLWKLLQNYKRKEKKITEEKLKGKGKCDRIKHGSDPVDWLIDQMANRWLFAALLEISTCGMENFKKTTKKETK